FVITHSLPVKNRQRDYQEDPCEACGRSQRTAHSGYPPAFAPRGIKTRDGQKQEQRLCLGQTKKVADRKSSDIEHGAIGYGGIVAMSNRRLVEQDQREEQKNSR